jgi:hypothetical protein
MSRALSIGRDILGLASGAANLGKEKVDTEGSVLVREIALELVNLFPEHFGRVTDTTDDTETTSVGDGSGQLRAGSHVHTCQQDGVVDLEQIGEGGTDFLWKTWWSV